MYSAYSLISCIVLAVNLTVTTLCACLIGSRAGRVADRSRYIFFGLSMSMVIPFLFRLCQLISQPDYYPLTEVLSPFKVYNGLLYLSLLILYPIEVMRPRWLNLRRTVRLMLPFLLFVGVALLAGPFTTLHSLDELRQHLSEFNVWWRLVSMLVTVVMFYVFLFTMPFNARRSSADRRWVRRYALLMTPIGLCFYAITFFFSLPVHILHILYIAFFVGYYTYYELALRLMPTNQTHPLPLPVREGSEYSQGEKAAEKLYSHAAEELSTPLPHREGQGGGSAESLFRDMDERIDRERLYCNPDFGRDELCRLTGLSHNGIGRLLQEHTDATNSQVYINSKRIRYAAQLLKEHPEYTVEAIAFDAGFRTKVTFHRLFKNTYNMTPAEYRKLP